MDKIIHTEIVEIMNMLWPLFIDQTKIDYIRSASAHTYLLLY